MRFSDGDDNMPGPGAYLRGDDPVSGAPMQHCSEMRAQTVEKAAFYLDAALSVRNASPETHMLYTLHVYQYTVPTGTSAGNRLTYFVDYRVPASAAPGTGTPTDG